MIWSIRADKVPSLDYNLSWISGFSYCNHTQPHVLVSPDLFLIIWTSNLSEELRLKKTTQSPFEQRENLLLSSPPVTESCSFLWPVNTEQPLSWPWKRRGGVQCKLMETFVKAHKDKAWQWNSHRGPPPLFYGVKFCLSVVLFNWAGGATTLFLFLSPWTLNLKTIQGILSCSR